jgi:hypothetical protein
MTICNSFCAIYSSYMAVYATLYCIVAILITTLYQQFKLKTYLNT